MNSIHKIVVTLGLFSAAVLATSCKRDPNNPGTEYAPQMYHSIAYEPLSQVSDFRHPYNEYGMNMRKPVAGTIARQFAPGDPAYMGRDRNTNSVMVYNLDPADINTSAATLRNPIEANEAILAEGQVLYNRYCAHCHGAEGDGQGKVAPVYKGIPNFGTGRYATLNEGHIFHTITYGQGRMWPHGSQVSPTERWKIVHWVQQLQNR
jgi:mono/diheme cytochrome c family protein